MTNFILQTELPIRLGFFFTVFLLMALWESAAPRRHLTIPRLRRWLNNLTLLALNTLVLRLLLPTAAVGAAYFAETQGWGLLRYFQLPLWAAIPAAVVILDFTIYLQHVMFHALPILWRLHRVHHADLDFDVTTGLRFHPIEILLSMLIKITVVILIGPPVAAVILFEVLLNASSMFNHGNVRLPLALDRIIRLLIVTPDMHRVHHSVEGHETNSNFGFNFSCWDRLFGTYQPQPGAGHNRMTVGIRSFRDEGHCVNLKGLLALPFTGKVKDYAINRRG